MALHWWQTAVIYQIYPRSFRDSTGSGIGDLPGITEKLPYLRETLGVDAVWLSPFYRSPMVDFGYDVSDHKQVDPVFGTLEDFDTLLAEAHRVGLRVVVDFVPNHTSDQHPWFIESRSSKTSATRDWYFWREGAPDGGPPNNWLSIWGGSGWEWDAGTGQYYYHHFAKEQPDLNWRNPEVREAMFDIIRFWLDRGVDGFRIDVADHIAKHPDLPDNPPNTSHLNFHKSFGDYDSQRHLYDRRHPDMHGFYRALRSILNAYGDGERVSIGEIHQFDFDKLVRHYGESLDELHLPFNFGLLKIPWNAQAVRNLVDAFEAALPEGAWPNYVLGNHDEPRLATRVGDAHARVAAMLLLTLRGTPTLYYGEELGMRDVAVPPERVHDPQAVGLPDLGRDPCRSPMLWQPGAGAGFTAPDVTPWLPLANDADRLNVATQLEEETSMLNLYRTLLRLRRRSPALQHGRYAPIDGPETCFVYVRQSGDERIGIALNFSDAPVELKVSAFEGGRIALSTQLDRSPVDRKEHVAGPLVLRAAEGVLIKC